ncbi:hypothetical protein OG689_07445 [Kitasatospora sp. NBC_00240]|uniref:hypothetical protein n=1 Tax=Kitasatospora sp. NBC_00240 TaxID=2903567 RepID=UPI00225A4A18|nr:hypothetical protein [Kitasatospora sp. NBC_00240]MCX5209121.1 hypothetical protein [Kitasatospora sp. NBC_00240]
MNDKSTRKCLAVVTPALAAQERIELVDVLQIGRVSAKRRVATAALVGAVSGGTVLVAVQPRAYFMVLTDRRLYLVDNHNGTVGRSIVSATPRDKITAGPLRKHLLTLSMEVRFTGVAEPSRFSWGRLQSRTALAIADALTT